MRVTRVTAVMAFVFYVFLWVLALNGVSSLVPVLAVPLVIALLVAVGVWLNRFMGITPRAQHFQEPPPAPPAQSGPPPPLEAPERPTPSEGAPPVSPADRAGPHRDVDAASSDLGDASR